MPARARASPRSRTSRLAPLPAARRCKAAGQTLTRASTHAADARISFGEVTMQMGAGQMGAGRMSAGRMSAGRTSAGVDFGLGLRPEHYDEIAANPGRVSWFEALSENYMVPGGGPMHWLDRIRRDYPVALHGVSLSIGSLHPRRPAHLGHL